ncbi:MAG: heavy metal-associated domain-containing protein [bacterium]
MKKIMRNFAAMLLLAFGLPLSSHAQLISADVGVDGLTCSMCARGTEETMKRLDFIDTMWVDLNTLVAHIQFKKDMSAPIEDIIKGVEDAGFSVRNITGIFEFTGQKIGKDEHVDYASDVLHFVGVSDRTLDGKVALRFIDKPFVSKKEFKEWANKTTMSCYKKNKQDDCCPSNTTKSKHLFHVTIAS